MPVVLVNEETEQVVLTLDGIERADQVFDGIVTDHPMSDGSTRADGRKIRPRTLSLTGTTASLAVVEGQLTGDARTEEVISTLRQLQVAATPLAAQIPGRAPIESMQIERFTEGYDPTENAPLTVSLKEILTASRRQVTLQAGARTGSFRDDIAAGREETEERGLVPNKALGASALDTLANLAGVPGLFGGG